MAKERNRDSWVSMQIMAAPGDNDQVDYSYDQWRHAQMRQLEQSYAQANEREHRLESHTGRTEQAA